MPEPCGVKTLCIVLVACGVSAQLGQKSCTDDHTCTGESVRFELLQRQLSVDGTESLSMAGNARRLLTPRTYTLFVKFHKVAGGTLRMYINAFGNSSMGCSTDCGCADWQQPLERPCERPQISPHTCQSWEIPNVCTHHTSMEVARVGLATQNISLLIPDDPSNPANCFPDNQRHSAFLSHAPFTSYWLPSQWSSTSRLLFITIMRDPTEKLRSNYYWPLRFDENPPQHSAFLAKLKEIRDDSPGNNTEHWGVKWNYENQKLCCEYLGKLGNWSLDQAKLVLATQFDLVGITERFDETMVSVAHLYQVSVPKLSETWNALGEKHDNSDGKLDWTPEEYTLAQQITALDAEIYSFAQDLFQRQLMNIWGTQAALDAAVHQYQALTATST